MSRILLLSWVGLGAVLPSLGCVADGYEVESQARYQGSSVEEAPRVGCDRLTLDLDREHIDQQYAEDLASADGFCRGYCDSAWFCCLCDSRCKGGVPSGCVSRGYAGCENAQSECQTRERSCIHRKRKQAAYDYCLALLRYENIVAECAGRPTGLPIGHAVNFVDYDGNTQVQTCFRNDYVFVDSPRL